jgi:mRNA interferase HigB
MPTSGRNDRVSSPARRDPCANIAGAHLPIFDDRHRHGRGRRYFADHAGHKGVKAARSQYDAWLDIVARGDWRNPQDIKASYPKSSVLKTGRGVFNIKGNDYRLVARVQYQTGVLVIRFFGTQYDEVDAETV